MFLKYGKLEIAIFINCFYTMTNKERTLHTLREKILIKKTAKYNLTIFSSHLVERITSVGTIGKHVWTV
jgi:hypothetical protein